MTTQHCPDYRVCDSGEVLNVENGWHECENEVSPDSSTPENVLKRM